MFGDGSDSLKTQRTRINDLVQGFVLVVSCFILTSNVMSSRFLVSSLSFPNVAVLVDFMQPSVLHQYRFEDPSHLLGLAIPTFTSKSLFSENNGGGAAIIFG